MLSITQHARLQVCAYALATWTSLCSCTASPPQAKATEPLIDQPAATTTQATISSPTTTPEPPAHEIVEAPGDNAAPLPAPTRLPRLRRLWSASANVPPVLDRLAFFSDTKALSAVDLETGKLAWRYRYEKNGWAFALQTHEGRVFAALLKGTVVALDQVTGRELWSKRGRCYAEQDLFVTRGALIASCPREDLEAYAVADGRALWTIHREVTVRPNIDVDDRALYLAEASLTAIDALTGAQLWVVNAMPPSAIVVPHGEFIVVLGADGHVMAFDRSTGAQRWDKTIAPRAAGDRAILRDRSMMGARSLIFEDLVLFPWPSEIIGVDAATGAVRKRWIAPSVVTPAGWREPYPPFAFLDVGAADGRLIGTYGSQSGGRGPGYLVMWKAAGRDVVQTPGPHWGTWTAAHDRLLYADLIGNNLSMHRLESRSSAESELGTKEQVREILLRRPSDFFALITDAHEVSDIPQAQGHRI